MSDLERSTPVSLVIFACEGREHLLRRSIQSFRQACPYRFDQVILAIDGDYSDDLPDEVAADLVVQNRNRSGYVRSILNALAVVETSYFFWLEDDWLFVRDVDVKDYIRRMEREPSLAQIRLSKSKPQSAVDTAGMYTPATVFSGNPNLSRTATVRAGFQALRDAPIRPQEEGWEEFLCEWIRKQGYTSRSQVAESGDPAIQHIGYLEATGRKWHMVSSLRGAATYVPQNRLLPGAEPWRRVAMALKLAAKCVHLAVRLFWSRSAYDLAFRIVHVNEDRAGKQDG